MPRVMGVNCDSTFINVAFAQDGHVLPSLPERVRRPGGLEESARLWAIYDDVARIIDD